MGRGPDLGEHVTARSRMAATGAGLRHEDELIQFSAVPPEYHGTENPARIRRPWRRR